MKTLLTLLALIGMALPAPMHAAVINPDGSGDFPTIQAALDVLPTDEYITLTPGIFTGPGNWDHQYVRPYF